MPTVQSNTSVTNGTTSANVLAGNQFEFIAGPATVSVYATFPSAGTAGDLLGNVKVNNVDMASDADLPNVDRYPIVPDDLLTSFRVPAGTHRLQLRFRNGSATTRVVRWRVDIA